MSFTKHTISFQDRLFNCHQKPPITYQTQLSFKSNNEYEPKAHLADKWSANYAAADVTRTSAPDWVYQRPKFELRRSWRPAGKHSYSEIKSKFLMITIKTAALKQKLHGREWKVIIPWVKEGGGRGRRRRKENTRDLGFGGACNCKQGKK